MSATLELTQDLIARNSVTPVDAGCQQVMGDRLAALGFKVESLRYGNVENLWATRGTGTLTICFAGHTDVVPTGPLEEWRSDPFKPVIKDGMLFGRGAADMKSGLAAMITATEEFVRSTKTCQEMVEKVCDSPCFDCPTYCQPHKQYWCTDEYEVRNEFLFVRLSPNIYLTNH